tara:strand:+ start:52762 stop:53385 length:624 start_codon:yes stop_codon:yes gene_type:complete
MLVVGAKGMAKELLELLVTEGNFNKNTLVFYDDIDTTNDLLYNTYSILHSYDAAKKYLKKKPSFTLGVGNPLVRKRLYKRFIELGGEPITVISTNATIGSFNTIIGQCCQIMQGVIITNDVTIGKGVLINLNTTISHDCYIGEFTEIACNVSIPGRCRIGKNVFIGSNATLMPDIIVGDNTVIGAGAMVVKDIPANTTVIGNPAKKI